VKLLRKSWLVSMALVAPLFALGETAFTRPAVAQDLKPVAVVAVASVEEMMADIGYLTTAAGVEDAGRTARFFAGAFTNGMDKKRPAGMYVVPKDGDFHAVAFVPVADLKQLLSIHKEYIGEPRDAGDGILEIGMDKSAFVKEQAGWAFVAESADHLADLPKDPAALITGLAKDYNIAGKVLVQNVPQELRQTALDEIKFGLERALENQQQGNVDRAQLEATTKQSLKQIEQLFNEADELTIGWAVDAAAKRTHIDVIITAKEGTDLAKQMALNVESKSAFGGMLLPEAAASVNFSAKLSEADIAQVSAAFTTVRAQVAAKIDDDPNLKAEQRAVAKEVVQKMLDVFEETAKSGKLDGGAALVLEAKSLSFVLGGYVADGPKFEKSVKDVLELAKNEPDVPKVQFNAGKIGDVTLHKAAIPVPATEAEARDLLGEKLDVILGIGPKSVYLAAGKGGESLLKKVMDQSVASADKSVPPMQINVALLPILKFSASMDPNNPILPGLIASLEKTGNDKVVLTSKGIERGSHARLEVQEGILRLIGEATKQFTGGQPPAGAF
jgi:hypothetical protein